MDRRVKECNLAALLDGELREAGQVDALQEMLSKDDALRQEYLEQSAVKHALAGLEHFAAPDFMATRVMGEIAERRKALQRQPRWRPLAALLGGAAALVAGFASTLSLLAPRTLQVASLTADGSARQPAVMVPAGLTQNMEYSPQFWADVAMPEGESSPELREFIRFANEAHNYRKLSRSTAYSPNMTEVMLALSPENQPEFVWASQGR